MRERPYEQKMIEFCRTGKEENARSAKLSHLVTGLRRGKDPVEPDRPTRHRIIGRCRRMQHIAGPRCWTCMASLQGEIRRAGRTG